MRQETELKQREKLSRKRIVEAALAIMDDEGLEAVTMRRVGRDLGVEAMSLYNHVRDKDDLLTGIRAHVLSQFEDPGTEGPWEERARQAARSWRQVLRAHPDMLRLISEEKTPDLSPDAIRPSEVALRMIREIGLSDADAVKAFCAFGGYILGFVMFEVGTMQAKRDAAKLKSPELLAAGLSADEFPCFLSSLPHLVVDDINERFEYGLDLMIAGMRAKTRSASH